MDGRIEDLRVSGFELLDSPETLCDEYPNTPASMHTVLQAREHIRAALRGDDRRLVVIVGPCSIHDPVAGLAYAEKLRVLADEVREHIIVVMRVYFEKPRTTVGWKGLINDPHLDGSCDINTGLRRARELLLKINTMGLPCATEFLDPIVPQYLSDLVAWTAIGARTTESQTHREMASGLSMPVGFKNATDGGLQIALDGIVSAKHPHAFLGIGRMGRSSIVRTTGNPDVHLVLRGGNTGPNYSRPHLAFAKAALNAAPGARQIMVDCSHGNSNKDFRKQSNVFRDVLKMWRDGERSVLGMMLESNLVEGRQDIGPNMVVGQSITDGCINFDETAKLLREVGKTL